MFDHEKSRLENLLTQAKSNYKVECDFEDEAAERLALAESEYAKASSDAKVAHNLVEELTTRLDQLAILAKTSKS